MTATRLYISGVPTQLVTRIAELAREERRSLNAQAIVLLERAVSDAEREREA